MTNIKLPSLSFILLILGIITHALLSEPLLIAASLDYASPTGGNMWEKIHIGAYLIYAAFLVMVFGNGNPLSFLIHLWRRWAAPVTLLALYVIATLFWLIRDPSGIGLLFDTHLPVPMAALCLALASPRQRNIIISFLLAFGLANAALGVTEGILQTRLLPYPDDWGVAHEDYFRASAFLGHPLNNALYTAVILLISQDRIRNMAWRSLATILLLTALVAFGGRAAILIASMTYGIGYLLSFNRETTTAFRPLYQVILRSGYRVFLPLILAGIVAALLTSPLGERLVAFADGHDSSAQSRLTALHIFDMMDTPDLWLGMSVTRLDEVRQKLTDHFAMSDIENPWLLMLLMLGGVLFPLWFAATARFLFWLWEGSNGHNRLALLTYLMVVSTSNGFGRKDSVYLLVISLLTALSDPKIRQNKTIPLPASPAPSASQ